jgi:PKD repeat protein
MGDYEMTWGQFSADGTLLWSKLYGAAGSDNPLAIEPAPGGGYTIVGFTNSYSQSPTDWQGFLVRTDAEGNADCDNINLDLTWTPQTALVTPFTSLTGSDFTVYPWPMGQESVAVGTYDPCCTVVAQFTSNNTGDYTWTFSDASTGASSYSWDFGDGTTSTEASPTHTYAANGTYTVCLTVTGECNGETTPATACETISVSVGIADINGAVAGLSLHPSLATDQFTVDSKVPMEAIRLLDSKGSLVRTITPQGMSVKVSVADLPAGAYTAFVVLANGQPCPLRLMVAH